MILPSPTGKKGPCPCRPGALTRRCERPAASIISSSQGTFTGAGLGAVESFKQTDAVARSSWFFRFCALDHPPLTLGSQSCGASSSNQIGTSSLARRLKPAQNVPPDLVAADVRRLTSFPRSAPDSRPPWHEGMVASLPTIPPLLGEKGRGEGEAAKRTYYHTSLFQAQKTVPHNERHYL